jgi:hypothetical protein
MRKKNFESSKTTIKTIFWGDERKRFLTGLCLFSIIYFVFNIIVSTDPFWYISLNAIAYLLGALGIVFLANRKFLLCIAFLILSDALFFCIYNRLGINYLKELVFWVLTSAILIIIIYYIFLRLTGWKK